MKRFLLFLLIFGIFGNAYAITRNGRSIKTDGVFVTGGASVGSTTATFGNACYGGAGSGYTATQLSSTSIPCQSATVCASESIQDVIFIGGSNVSYDKGVPLSRGTSTDRCAVFNVDDVNLLYGCGKASNDKAVVTYVDIV